MGDESKLTAEKKPSFRLFGRKKSSDESAGAPLIVKSKSFKRIRGFIKGKIGKKKTASSASRSLGDESSVLNGVDVDDRSVATTSYDAASGVSSLLPKDKAVTKAPAYMLKVVLLLMDPTTRRFELLQLEFDSFKALVSDVLAQIPVSVTEEVLRKQTYTGICGADGNEMDAFTLLSKFCKGNEVLVAIPTNVAASECARLAKPILGDDKVIAMVRSISVSLGRSLCVCRYSRDAHTIWMNYMDWEP
jgi:hypothetical protein